jgi:hypothetical protein
VLKRFDNVPSRTHWKCPPKLRPPAKEVLLKRTATSTRDLERVEVMGRVAQEGLRLVDAAAMLQFTLSQGEAYVATQVGRQGMKHAHARRPSNLKSR